jgi:hypothetical protein
VLSYRIVRHSAEITERLDVPFQERFGRLGRKRHHEAIVRLRQIQAEVVRLLLLAGDRHQRLAEIRLRVSGRMRQWHKHLPPAQLPLPQVIFHDRVAAGKRILLSQTLEDPLGVPLFGRPPLVLFQNLIDDSDPGAQFRPPDRLLPAIPRRNRIPHILRTVSREIPNSRAAARSLSPSICTARRTRAYSSTVYTSPVCHQHNPIEMFGSVPAGLLLLRHEPPLTRRPLVHFYSAAYTSG